MTDEEKKEQEKKEQKTTEEQTTPQLTAEELADFRREREAKLQAQNRNKTVEEFINEGDENVVARKRKVYEGSLKHAIEKNPDLANSKAVLKDAYLWNLQKMQDEAREKAKSDGVEILDDDDPENKEKYSVDSELAALGIRVRKPAEEDGDGHEAKTDKLDINTDNIDENLKNMARQAGVDF